MKKNVKMNTAVTVGSNYAGVASAEILGASFKEADTLRLGLVTVIDNINYELNLRRVRYTDGRVAYSCGFTPAGSITLSEKVLKPIKFKNDISVCKEDFRPTWSSELQGASAWNETLASDIESAVIVEVLAEQSQQVDFDIWNGTTGNTSSDFVGFLPQFAADATIIDVAGAVITEANVEAELKKALNVVPVALRRKDLNVMVAPNVFQAYVFYLISKGIANGLGGEDKQAKFGRYTLTEVSAYPDDTIVIGEPRNFIFGTGLQSDHNLIQAVDEDAIGLMTGNVRMKMVYNMGVGYYNGEDIVYYRP